MAAALDPQIAALMGNTPAPAAAATPVLGDETAAAGLDPQLQQLAAQADAYSKAPPAPPTGPEHLANVLNVFTRHPFTAGMGMVDNAVQGMGSAAAKFGGRVADLVTGEPNNRAQSWEAATSRFLQPTMPAATELQQVAAEEPAHISSAYDQLPGANTPLGQTLKSAVPEAATDLGMFLGPKGLFKPDEAMTNIGLNVGNKVGAVSPSQALAALRARGVKVTKSAVQQSNTEPTLVARTSAPLTPAQGNAVAGDLGQEAIVQAERGGGGELYGPQAGNWGPFNPEYFRNLQGAPLQGAQDPLLASAARLRLGLTPEQAGGGYLARAMQSLGGSAKLERGISIKNAPGVDAASARAAGVPGGTQLSEGALRAAKAAPNAVYAEAARTGTIDVSQLDPTLTPFINDALKAYRLPPISDDGTMEAPNLVNAVRQLRATGYANIKAQRYNPALKALGQNQVDAANALDDALDAHVQQLAKTAPGSVRPDLMPRLLAARQQLATIASVKQALGSDGHVNALNYAKQLGRGAPLQGDLKDIGLLADKYPRSFQPLNKIRDSGPFSVLDLFAGAEGLHRVPAMLGAVAGRPILRAILESKAYQRALTAPPRAPLGLTPFPFARRVAPLVPFAQWQSNPLLPPPEVQGK